MATKHGTHNRPKYEGPSINVAGFDLEAKRELCRFVLARTRRIDPSGSAMGTLVVGVERNHGINLGGTGAPMNGVDQSAYAALHPSVAELVDGWIAWFKANRTR